MQRNNKRNSRSLVESSSLWPFSVTLCAVLIILTLCEHSPLCAYCFVEGAVDNFELLRAAELDEMYGIAGDADGQLGI